MFWLACTEVASADTVNIAVTWPTKPCLISPVQAPANRAGPSKLEAAEGWRFFCGGELLCVLSRGFGFEVCWVAGVGCSCGSIIGAGHRVALNHSNATATAMIRYDFIC